MVQILQESQNNIDSGSVRSQLTSKSNGHSTTSEDDHQTLAIDSDLVAEVRKSLKEAYESADDETYARGHYERIMDEKAPMTCWRYLLHCHRNPTDTVDLMKRSLAWRQESDVDQLGPKQLPKDLFLKAPAGWTGKSRDGHEVVYIIGKNYRKPDSSMKQIIRNFITYALRKFDDKHKDDLEQLIAVFDVTDTTFSNMDLDFVTWLISVRDYFPRRFFAIYIVGIPFLIRPIIRLIISWLPENYKQITYCGTFDDLVKANIDDDQLPYEVGGTADDRWRIAPTGSVWANETKEYTEEVMTLLEKAICFNIPKERLDKIIQMQVDHDLNNSEK